MFLLDHSNLVLDLEIGLMNLRLLLPYINDVFIICKKLKIVPSEGVTEKY